MAAAPTGRSSGFGAGDFLRRVRLASRARAARASQRPSAGEGTWARALDRPSAGETACQSGQAR